MLAITTILPNTPILQIIKPSPPEVADSLEITQLPGSQEVSTAASQEMGWL